METSSFPPPHQNSVFGNVKSHQIYFTKSRGKDKQRSHFCLGSGQKDIWNKLNLKPQIQTSGGLILFCKHPRRTRRWTFEHGCEIRLWRDVWSLLLSWWQSSLTAEQKWPAVTLFNRTGGQQDWRLDAPTTPCCWLTGRTHDSSLGLPPQEGDLPKHLISATVQSLDSNRWRRVHDKHRTAMSGTGPRPHHTNTRRTRRQMYLDNIRLVERKNKLPFDWSSLYPIRSGGQQDFKTVYSSRNRKMINIVISSPTGSLWWLLGHFSVCALTSKCLKGKCDLFQTLTSVHGAKT